MTVIPIFVGVLGTITKGLVRGLETLDIGVRAESIKTTALLSRHDWVGKVIHWEMCKKFKFDHSNKWYMHNTAAALENDTHKLLNDLDIQTDHLITARRPDLIIINKIKRTCKIENFAVSTDHRIKLKECEKKDKYFDLARGKKKKQWNMKITIVLIVIGAFGTVTKELLNGLEDLEVGG